MESSIIRYFNEIPRLGNNIYLAEGARIIGSTILSDNVSIWFNTVIRGDVNKISIGENTNIQDLSMLHVTSENALHIGKNVTVGHSVTLHGCRVGDNALIGMGATILDNVEIGDYSIVAAGSVVTPNKKFPSKSMIMGTPAKVIRPLNDSEIDMLDNHYKSYLKYAENFIHNSKNMA